MKHMITTERAKALRYNIRESDLLYKQKTESWGIDVGPQTWNWFLVNMIESFWIWYVEHCNKYSDSICDLGADCCFQEYVRQIMEEELEEWDV